MRLAQHSNAAAAAALCLLLAPCVVPSSAFQGVSSFAGGKIRPASMAAAYARSVPRHSSSRSSSSGSRSTGLSMHFGHSHSHNHHGHEHKVGDGANGDDAVAPPAPAPPKTIAGKVARFATRRTARIAFAAIAILGPALIRNSRIAKSDMAIFLVTSTVLSLVDAGRRELKTLIFKIKRFREGWVKHSTPLVDTRRIFGSDKETKESSADRVTLLGVVVNLALSVGKAIIGVTCHSSALIADAGHSLSDLFSDFITLWAVQIGRLPPDEDHPYGHGKFEAMGSLFLAMTLLATGLSVGASSGRKLTEIIAAQRSGGAAFGVLIEKVPTAPALAMAAVSIVSKEWLYRITRRVGEALNSQVVIANAWHHRSDAYSSVLALVSIGLAMSVPSLLAADAAAGILVAGMICMTGAEIFGESVNQLTDTMDTNLIERVETVIRTSGDGSDVLDVKRVRARQVGSSAIVDVSITTPAGHTSSANRAIEERLRWAIMEEPGVIDAEVHSAPLAGSHDVVCPLLSAEEVRGNIVQPPSTTSVEGNVRRVLGAHPDVRSVEGVWVNYRDTMLVDVDATIRIDVASTVAKANGLAVDLKDQLEEEEDIDKASIYLDLNEAAEVLTASTAGATP